MKFAFLTAAAVACAFAAPAAAQFSTAHPVTNRTPVATGAPAGSYSAINTYAIDDGVTENALGLTAGGDFVFIQAFTAVGGSDVISKVSCSYGTTLTPPNSPPAGTPIKIFIWSDPNQDSNPADGVILQGPVAGVIGPAPDTDTFDVYPVPLTPVSGIFFVGVVVPQVAGQFPGPMDTTTSIPATAWVTGNGVAGSYTGAPTTGTIGLFDMIAIGFPALWLLRAEGGYATTQYCTGKANSQNGAPLCPNGVVTIGSSGASSVTPGAPPFTISGVNSLNNKVGILIYKNSVGGSAQGAQPFNGGLLCLASGLAPNRVPSVLSGGTPAPTNDCSGVYAVDMNLFAQGGIPGPPFPQAYLLVIGQEVVAQWWGRDPGFAPPNNVQLSDGIMWNIGP